MINQFIKVSKKSYLVIAGAGTFSFGQCTTDKLHANVKLESENREQLENSQLTDKNRKLIEELYNAVYTSSNFYAHDIDNHVFNLKDILTDLSKSLLTCKLDSCAFKIVDKTIIKNLLLRQPCYLYDKENLIFRCMLKTNFGFIQFSKKENTKLNEYGMLNACSKEIIEKEQEQTYKLDGLKASVSVNKLDNNQDKISISFTKDSLIRLIPQFHHPDSENEVILEQFSKFVLLVCNVQNAITQKINTFSSIQKVLSNDVPKTSYIEEIEKTKFWTAVKQASEKSKDDKIQKEKKNKQYILDLLKKKLEIVKILLRLNDGQIIQNFISSVDNLSSNLSSLVKENNRPRLEPKVDNVEEKKESVGRFNQEDEEIKEEEGDRDERLEEEEEDNKKNNIQQIEKNQPEIYNCINDIKEQLSNLIKIFSDKI